MPTPTFHRSPSRRGRLVALTVAAGVAAVLSFGFLIAGGALLWADGEKDADGYVSTSSERFSSGTYAIATEDLDIDLDGAGELLDALGTDTVKLAADARGDQPVFVGIARSDDVARYLGGTEHTRVTELDSHPFRAEYRDAAGDRRPAQPARQAFWAASAEGAGTQTLTWDVRDGDWSVVVMNADGSRDVDASVSAGAELPFLGGAGWASLGAGLLLLVTAGGFVYLGVRGPRAGGGDGPTPLGAAQPAV